MQNCPEIPLDICQNHIITLSSDISLFMIIKCFYENQIYFVDSIDELFNVTTAVNIWWDFSH